MVDERIICVHTKIFFRQLQPDVIGRDLSSGVELYPQLFFLDLHGGHPGVAKFLHQLNLASDGRGII